jgi:hypothetical protein
VKEYCIHTRAYDSERLSLFLLTAACCVIHLNCRSSGSCFFTLLFPQQCCDPSTKSLALMFSVQLGTAMRAKLLQVSSFVLSNNAEFFISFPVLHLDLDRQFATTGKILLQSSYTFFCTYASSTPNYFIGMHSLLERELLRHSTSIRWLSKPLSDNRAVDKNWTSAGLLYGTREVPRRR